MGHLIPNTNPPYANSRTNDILKDMKHKRSGFTIIEILVVVIIVGILATIATITYAGIKNDTEASAAAHKMRNIQKSMMASAVKAQRALWWSEAELSNCSAGSTSGEPYLVNISTSCEELRDLRSFGEGIDYKGQSIELQYDNDSDATLNKPSTCGDTGTGINLTNSSNTASFTDDFLSRVDNIIDEDDGNDCGQFRWSSDGSQLFFILSVSEKNI